MYPVGDLYAEANENTRGTTGDPDATGKAASYAGEVLTTVGTLALGLGVLAAEALWKSAPKVLRATGTGLRTIADSMEGRK